MKSPITGKTMQLQMEKRVISFRKEEFEVLYQFYLCEDSGEQFTTDELDELNLSQLYNQYRAKFNLPFPEEIIAIREKYGLPANKMAEVLGFGVNVYRNYENGEIPSQSNARLIQMIKDPQEFLKLLNISKVYEGEELIRKSRKIEMLIEKERSVIPFDLEEYLLGRKLADQYTGFKVPNLNRFVEMVVFFAERIKPYKTKMNKLLFYADFLNFKKTCYSISGARYIAIQRGPVPKNFDSLFDYAARNHCIDICYSEFEQGIGAKFLPHEERSFNGALFTEQELEILELVVTHLGKSTTSEVVELSHEENAWSENVKGYKQIDYSYGFQLKSI